MTNFDRITESPEKLAEFLREINGCCYSVLSRCATCPLVYRCVDSESLLEWLQEESDD